MANSYSQIYIHIIFAVKGRQNLIHKPYQEEFNKYVTGIVTNKGQKMLAIGGMPDHIHIFIGMNPTKSISDLVRDIKANSSKFINEKRWVKGKFQWQSGFGAFSYSRSHIDPVVKYILNQEKYHAKKSFKEEYIELLQKFEIEYDKNYLFEWIDY
jgi:REP element-mobilizing transposase RayT